MVTTNKNVRHHHPKHSACSEYQDSDSDSDSDSDDEPVMSQNKQLIAAKPVVESPPVLKQ